MTYPYDDYDPMNINGQDSDTQQPETVEKVSDTVTEAPAASETPEESVERIMSEVSEDTDSQIFSDSFLPSEGMLHENNRNFDRSRMLLFDETRVYDSVARDGYFPDFSNSFLISCLNAI